MKNLTLFVLAFSFMSVIASAQSVATRDVNGKEVLTTAPTVSSGNSGSKNTPKSTAVASAEPKRFVSHRAVLLGDGTQQMQLIDADGKQTIITATEKENLQVKYWEYLQKEGLPCACSSSTEAKAGASPIQTSTAVRDEKTGVVSLTK